MRVPTRATVRRDPLAVVTVVALVVAIVLWIAAAVALAQADDEIEIVDVETTADAAVLVVSTPDWLREDGVGPGSFIVSVGGRVVTPVVEPLPGERLDVVLALDVSGSMAGAPLIAAKQSAARYIEQMPDGARVAIIAFGDEAEVVTPFTSDKAAAVGALSALDAAGETSLHQAIVRAAGVAGQSDGVPLMILLSDGTNTVEGVTAGQAVDAVVASGASLQVISIESEDASRADLRAIAQATDGSLAEVTDIGALDALYGDLAEDLRNYFELQVPAPTASGPTELVLRAADIGERRGETAVTSIIVPFAERVAEASGDTSELADVSRPDITLTAPAEVVADRGEDRLLRWGAIAALVGGLVMLALPSLLRGVGARTDGRGRRIQSYLGSQAPTAEGGRMRTLLAGLSRRVRGTGPGGALRAALERAGWQLRTTEFLAVVAGLVAAAVLLGSLVSGPFAIALGFIVVAAVGALMLLAAGRRRDEFERQLNGTLQMLAGALRAGYSLPQAFAFVGAEAPAPTGEEFNRIVLETRLGVDLVDAARGTAERMRSEDFDWVVDATDIARDVGGDLAEVFDNVASTIRTRGQIARQVKTLSAEGRISAWILAILPLPLLLWQLAVNRDYTMLLFTTSMGLVIFVVSVALLIVGSLWMRRLVDVEF